jgi:hypothetical protein
MLQLQDVFSNTISKAKELGMWEKLTLRQKESLVSKYLLEYFNKKQTRLKTSATEKS